MKYLVLLLRWVVGLLFIFSGLVKTIDPIGFSIKLEEYFSPAVFDIPLLEAYALPLATFFVIFEIILGFTLILGIFRKFTLWSLLGLIVFFTFLTFYSAYFNKVTDCGCFGDALPLTPWESFTKDVVLLVLILIIWIGRKYIRPILAKPLGKYVTLAAFLIAAFIAYRGIYHLPIKDFRAYSVGKNITESMKSAEELGLEPPQIQLIYFLKNKLNNQTVKLTEDEYLADKDYWATGTPWEIVETEDKVVKEGYEPPIVDFMIDCREEGEKTEEYLQKEKLLIVVTSIPEKASKKGTAEINQLVDQLKGSDIEMLSLSPYEINTNGIPNCSMDPVTLKTITRANPGIVLLKKGTVMGKFNWNDIPDAAGVQKIMN